MSDNLAACPCGEIPHYLCVEDLGAGYCVYLVSGDCCGNWHVLFKSEHAKAGSEENGRKAIETWNAAQRADK